MAGGTSTSEIFPAEAGGYRPRIAAVALRRLDSMIPGHRAVLRGWVDAEVRQFQFSHLPVEVREACRRRVAVGRRCDIPLSGARLASWAAGRPDREVQLQVLADLEANDPGRYMEITADVRKRTERFRPGSPRFWTTVAAEYIVGRFLTACERQCGDRRPG
jgi:hypothetical protein